MKKYKQEDFERFAPFSNNKYYERMDAIARPFTPKIWQKNYLRIWKVVWALAIASLVCLVLALLLGLIGIFFFPD